MSLLQELTLVAAQAPAGTALAALLMDPSQDSFILVVGPVLKGRLADAGVRTFVANTFLTLLEKMGQEATESPVTPPEPPHEGTVLDGG